MPSLNCFVVYQLKSWKQKSTRSHTFKCSDQLHSMRYYCVIRGIKLLTFVYVRNKLFSENLVTWGSVRHRLDIVSLLRNITLPNRQRGREKRKGRIRFWPYIEKLFLVSWTLRRIHLNAKKRYFHIVLDVNDDKIRRTISVRTPSTPLQKYSVDRSIPHFPLGAYFVGIPSPCAVLRLHHFVARVRIWNSNSRVGCKLHSALFPF